jgi:hypothetical protein
MIMIQFIVVIGTTTVSVCKTGFREKSGQGKLRSRKGLKNEPKNDLRRNVALLRMPYGPGDRISQSQTLV